MHGVMNPREPLNGEHKTLVPTPPDGCARFDSAWNEVSPPKFQTLRSVGTPNASDGTMLPNGAAHALSDISRQCVGSTASRMDLMALIHPPSVRRQGNLRTYDRASPAIKTSTLRSKGAVPAARHPGYDRERSIIKFSACCF